MSGGCGRALREQALPLALFAVPLVIALAVGPSRVLAYYEGVIHVGVDVGASWKGRA